jgi:hypothetical protein
VDGTPDVLKPASSFPRAVGPTGFAGIFHPLRGNDASRTGISEASRLAVATLPQSAQNNAPSADLHWYSKC